MSTTVSRVLKQAANGAAHLLPKPDVTTRRVVLCYHSVHPSVPYSSATPAEFAAHLDWLAATCDVVPLETLVTEANHAGRPRVALTFDDGYADNHEHALPALAERNLPATFFVTAGFLERDPDVLAHLSTIWETAPADLDPLSWS